MSFHTLSLAMPAALKPHEEYPAKPSLRLATLRLPPDEELDEFPELLVRRSTAGPLAGRIERRRLSGAIHPEVSRLLDELDQLTTGVAPIVLDANHLRAVERAANALRSARLRRSRSGGHVATCAAPNARRRKRLHSLKETLLRIDPHCAYCHCTLSIRSATLDHVTPQSHGGEHKPANLVLCCGACNTAKADRMPERWAEDILRAAKSTTTAERIAEAIA